MSSLTDIDPRDTRVVHSARHYAALQYLDQHAAMYLDDQQLLHACTVALVADHQVPDAYTAHSVAVAALAEIHSRTRPAWIDISLSTSLVCRVIDPVSGQVANFTAAELIRIALERAQAITGATPDGEAPRPPRCIN